MVTEREKHQLTPKDFASPALDALNEMAVKYLGLRLVIVYPKADGMGQFVVGKGNYLADYCKLVQGSKEGAEHCRMCHLLMSQTSPPGSSLVKRCHTGVSSLVKLVSSGNQNGNLAVITSCTLIDESDSIAWKTILRRGKKLGIDEQKFKKAHQALHKLGPEKMELANYIMTLTAEVLTLLLDKMTSEAALENEKKRHTPDTIITTTIENKLRGAISNLQDIRKKTSREINNPSVSLIDIVTDVVAKKPNLPYRLNTVAAACRLTPNHFSHLFHEHHKQCFSDFLTEQRLDMAKNLLKDLTLNISQVAAESGFRDAGYFARRFRQKNGVSPRDWRNKISLG